MAQGIITTIERAAALVLIAPVLFLALSASMRGDWPLAIAFGGVAGLMFGLGEIVTRPSDLPGEALERVASALTTDD
ncbi:MAG: hypothetical protein ABEJ86_03260 [Halococcoides sp.]